jgi:hypothetical protein
MFLTVTELNTHLYGEIVREITRYPEFTPGEDEDDEPVPVDQDDNVIAKKAIRAGISEVQSYLSKYDTDFLFSQSGDNRDEHLLFIVKDVAAWHLVSLANPNIDLSLRERRYDAAIDWLNRVQRGAAVPNYPLLSGDGPGGVIGIVKTGSNQKRGNYY